MALTLKRWLLVAVMACGTIAVWQMPARDAVAWSGPRARGAVSDEYGYVRRYGWPDVVARLSETTLHLHVLQLRDSVFTPRALADAAPGLEILIDRQFSESIQRSMRHVLENAWHAYAPGSRYPVAVALVEDTAKTLAGLPMGHNRWLYVHVFPPDSTTAVCRVLARVRVDLASRHANDGANYVRRIVTEEIATQYSGRTILGPCAIYATFGKPGPRVAEWLAQTAWRPGRAVDWNRESPVLRDEYFARYGIPQPAVDFTGTNTPAWQMRYQLSDNGIACVGGDGLRCVSGVLEPAFAMPGDSGWRSGVIDLGSPWFSPRVTSAVSLGPSVEWVLSDMVHDLGRRRFETFWASAATVPAAFEAASGVPLSAWLERWAQRAYGSDVLGPSVPSRARLAGLLVVLAGLVVAVVFASERRVA
jgi:hypothetical protein